MDSELEICPCFCGTTKIDMKDFEVCLDKLLCDRDNFMVNYMAYDLAYSLK